MKFRPFISNLICSCIPGKSRRDKVRVLLRYNTRPFVKFVREYINDPKAKITTCVGFGCRNFIVLVDSRYAFKFPLLEDGHAISLREMRITNALRGCTSFKIPEMEIIKWKNLSIRKYEFFSGVTLDEVPPRIALSNRHHIAKQIALFLYEIGTSDPESICDLKVAPANKPGFLYGWFHNDIGGNFILNPETLDIVGFIDWETASFDSFDFGLYVAGHYWEKCGYHGLIVDVVKEYCRLYYEKK